MQYFVISKSYKVWRIEGFHEMDLATRGLQVRMNQLGYDWIVTAGPFATEQEATDHALGYMRANITPEDVEDLKHQWYRDPIWDLEQTPGYEAYHDELLAYSTEVKLEWARLREYEQQRSAQHNVDKAMNCLDYAGEIGGLTRTEALMRAQVHATLALVAEMKRYSDNSERQED